MEEMIYINDNIKLFLGNSNELIKNIDDKSIDLIVIDPPYLLNMKGANPNRNDFGKEIINVRKELESLNIIDGYDIDILNELVRVMKKVNIYIWCNIKQLKSYLDFFVGKLDCSVDILVWNKINAMPLFNNKYLTDKEYCLYFRKRGYCMPKSYEKAKTVFNLPINQRDKKLYGHPTIKPIAIIQNLVENSSKENETILDCFMGSGTTGVAVVNAGCNRNFIGMEISEKYYEFAKNRINEAIKLKGGTK